MADVPNLKKLKEENLMKRLTDKRTAEALKHNADGLKAKGFDVPIGDLRYIKLAEYENEEERRERTSVKYDPDDYYE
jgi:hypothetical protein